MIVEFGFISSVALATELFSCYHKYVLTGKEYQCDFLDCERWDKYPDYDKIEMLYNLIERAKYSGFEVEKKAVFCDLYSLILCDLFWCYYYLASVDGKITDRYI